MRITLIILTLLTVGSCQNKQSEIFEFRGLDKSGIYYDVELLSKWPENGLETAIIIDSIGNGFGSPTFVYDKFLITGEIDSLAYLFCYTLEGTLTWKANLGREWVNSFPGSRSAPTITDKLVYVSTGMGNLFCLDIDDGAVVWSKTFEEMEGVYPLHGHAESSTIYKDKVFWTVGGKKHNVVALDRFTGELLWTNPGYGEVMGYNPGKLIKLPERTIFVTWSAYHLLGFDADTGVLLWSHEQDNYPLEKRNPGYGDTHSNSVIFEDMAIYYAAGDGNCGVKLELSEDGTSIREIWRNKRFDSYMGGIIKLDKHIYGCGTAGRDLRSADAETGMIIDSLALGSGAIIAADSMLYYYDQRGFLHLIDYENGYMTEISKFKVKEGNNQHFAHPVIYRKLLYQRHGNVLIGYKLSN